MVDRLGSSLVSLKTWFQKSGSMAGFTEDLVSTVLIDARFTEDLLTTVLVDH